MSAVLVPTSCSGHHSQFVYNLTLPPLVATLTVSVQLNCTPSYGYRVVLEGSHTLTSINSVKTPLALIVIENMGVERTVNNVVWLPASISCC